MSFRDIELKPEYRSRLDNVIRDFYNPVLKQAVTYKRAVGFFSSSALLSLTAGICGLVENGGSIQMIASPRLLPEDIEAINDGIRRRDEVIKEALLREFINHSPEQFAYFDNRTDVSLTREQRSLFKAFNNVSRLFSVNRCVFFSINLLTSKVNRSQAAHDIHTMIHPVVEADGTICLFCHDDEVMLSFLGFGLRCILSDWYPMADENETLLEKLDIANFSIVRGTDYFSDMIYLLARNYYQSGQPSTYELIPIDFISRAGVDEIDREALNQYVQDQLNAPLYEYGDDYVEYDESAQIQNTDIGADLDLMLLEMDDEDDNPFGEDIEPEDDLDDDDEFFDEDAESENKDEYEFDDIDPEIFRDPLLMVKWLNRHTQNQS